MSAGGSWQERIRRFAARWGRRRDRAGAARDERDEAGRWGEEIAARRLRGQGFKVLGRRIRLGRREEIDIVARDGPALVFVEVKTRRSEEYGRPIESIGRAKRLRLSRAAIGYLHRLRRKPDFIRFDVVEVVGRPGDADPVVRHIPNAFPLEGRLRFPG
jgi:putative endonuclease